MKTPCVPSIVIARLTALIQRRCRLSAVLFVTGLLLASCADKVDINEKQAYYVKKGYTSDVAYQMARDDAKSAQESNAAQVGTRKG